MTPREFFKMTRMSQDNQRHEDYRAAVVALPLHNWGRKEHELKQAEDLFPSLKPKPSKATPEDHMAAFRAWEAAGFGRVGKLNA